VLSVRERDAGARQREHLRQPLPLQQMQRREEGQPGDRRTGECKVPLHLHTRMKTRARAHQRIIRCGRVTGYAASAMYCE
jgi:hypothetical protein